MICFLTFPTNIDLLESAPKLKGAFPIELFGTSAYGHHTPRRIKTDPPPELLSQTSRILTEGGCVVIPTFCLYGMAANAFDEEAVRRLFAIKERPSTNPILLLIEDRDAVDALVSHIPAAAEALMDHLWPGKTHPGLPRPSIHSEGDHRRNGQGGLKGSLSSRDPGHRPCRPLSHHRHQRQYIQKTPASPLSKSWIHASLKAPI